jgi:PhnB protein
MAQVTRRIAEFGLARIPDSRATKISVSSNSNELKEIKMTTRVNPIPAGFHTVTPHLVVKGASEAIEFYKKAFDAEEVVRMPGPDGKLIMHAEIKIGDSIIFLRDEFPDAACGGSERIGASRVSIHLYVNDVDATFKAALEAGAKEQMPLADMFWGDRFGSLVDPFGHEWSVATHKEDVTPEEMRKRSQQSCPEQS